MKLFKLIFALIICVSLNSCATVKTPQVVSGIYRFNELTYEFKENKCIATLNGKHFSECHVKIENDLLYMSPDIPEMEGMIRNVWVVWDIRRNKLISKYLVDMDDGTRFYENKAGEVVLKKQ